MKYAAIAGDGCGGRSERSNRAPQSRSIRASLRRSTDAPATSFCTQGNIVKANADTAMVVINQVKPVYVDFALPEQELARFGTTWDRIRWR